MITSYFLDPIKHDEIGRWRVSARMILWLCTPLIGEKNTRGYCAFEGCGASYLLCVGALLMQY